MPAIKFNDGVARVIDHVYVCFTTYLFNVLKNGNGLSEAMENDSKVYLQARGFANANDTKPTQTLHFCVADANGFVTEWTKWDLSGLGAIEKLEFNMYGEGEGMDNGYGFSQLAYFAWDDMAVRFPTDENAENTTALPSVTIKKTARKILVNGQLFIIREEKIYNAQGIRVY